MCSFLCAATSWPHWVSISAVSRFAAPRGAQGLGDGHPPQDREVSSLPNYVAFFFIYLLLFLFSWSGMSLPQTVRLRAAVLHDWSLSFGDSCGVVPKSFIFLCMMMPCCNDHKYFGVAPTCSCST